MNASSKSFSDVTTPPLILEKELFTFLVSFLRILIMLEYFEVMVILSLFF